jgi:prolyl-tRNA synthetase
MVYRKRTVNQKKQQARVAISPTREEDYAKWYQAVVREAEMAEMSHVRGCMVIKPWGYGIWSKIQQQLDRRIKETGHENAYFPLFIPLSYIAKEAEHVEGFAKEMAVVTHHRVANVGGELMPAPEAKLSEALIVRPTSETIIGASMAQWIKSYRDLPLLLNQWCNVVRWEMRPRVFLRTTEFLWQEGHTAHATSEEARRETETMLEVYREFVEEYLAIAVIRGEKSANERFPGAEQTLAVEAMMQDGKALQAGTSHYLGQNFARAAGIKFLDENGQEQFAFTTSWGVSTRLIGALIMTHGDDNGLRVPPRVAPTHVVIVPILRSQPADASVLEYAQALAAAVRAKTFGGGIPIEVRVDERLFRSVDKRWQWIKKGVPIVLEIGSRDVESGSVTMLVRTKSPQEQEQVSREEFVSRVAGLLDKMQRHYFEESAERLRARVSRDVSNFEQFAKYFEDETRGGFVAGKWCGRDICEERIRELGVTIRCLPLEQSGEAGYCVICGQDATTDAIYAKAY